MRLDVVTSPKVAHRRLAHALAGGHETATPVRVPFGLGLQGGVDHGLDLARAVGWFSTPAGRDLPQTCQPLRQETFSPQPNRFPIDLQLGGNGRLGLAGAGGQHNPAAKRPLLRGSQWC